MIEIIGVTYNHGRKLDIFLASVLEQTDSNLITCSIYHDGPPTPETHEQFKKWDLEFERERVSFNASYCEDRRNDFGHSLRAWGLEKAGQEFVNFQNCDNYLTPRFVELLLTEAKEKQLDFVYCDILHSYANTGDGGKGPYNVLPSRPAINYMDIANFAVKTDWAKQVGFNHRVSYADGLFVEELMQRAQGRKIGKVESCLVVHN